MPTLFTALPEKREPAIQTRGLAHLFRRLRQPPWNSTGRGLGKPGASPRYSSSGGAFSEGGKGKRGAPPPPPQVIATRGSPAAAADEIGPTAKFQFAHLAP